MNKCGEKFRHGLVLGKFYPPHAGHHHLISTAAARCAQLTVLVMAASDESISVADRVRWLSAMHVDSHVDIHGVPCDAPVDYADDVIWAAQMATIKTAVSIFSDSPIDVVFSSETYGDELAGRMGAAHVTVDPDRRLFPISGTSMRQDLPRYWRFLAPETAADLAVRVVILGAESTGTSTIAQRLAEHYRRKGAPWHLTPEVAEYGREFTEVKWQQAKLHARMAGIQQPLIDELQWEVEDFDHIAYEQTRREEAAARSGSPLVICDTDAFATSIWERRYLGSAARTGQPWATTLLPRRDIYLLTTHENVPWVDDGMREGDLAIRADMTAWFGEELTRAGHSWVLLSGTLDQRLHLAVRVIDRLARSRFSFSASITQSSAASEG